MQFLSPEHRAASVLGAIIASAVDGIVVIDAQGRIETTACPIQATWPCWRGSGG